MEDILLLEYLKKKGILNEQECHNIVNKDIEKEDKYSSFFNGFKTVTKEMSPSEKMQFIDRLKDYDNKQSEHFNESYAKYIVSKMWHKDESGIKCIGEKYDILKAKEICERYRGIIPNSVTYADIYIAINSQYHDYYCLFNRWFVDDIDYKIIESAIKFWFKDEDCESFKLWDYFKDK